MGILIYAWLNRSALNHIAEEHPEFRYIAGMNVTEDAGIRVVVKEGQVRDWAAYWGPARWDFDVVERGGSKLSEEAALTIFPFLVSMDYRR